MEYSKTEEESMDRTRIRNSAWMTIIIEKHRRKTWKRKAQNSIYEAGDRRYRNRSILEDEEDYK
jgi:hypothetical protein